MFIFRSNLIRILAFRSFSLSLPFLLIPLEWNANALKIVLSLKNYIVSVIFGKSHRLAFALYLWEVRRKSFSFDFLHKMSWHGVNFNRICLP